MKFLLDTNLLTRSIQPRHPLHREATDAIALLFAGGDIPCIVPQNLYEFWAVATRPESDNGLGLSCVQAEQELAGIKARFELLHDSSAILPIWEGLVSKYATIGKKAHDARLVAAMSVHGLTTLLTFNSADFTRYLGITVMSPSELSAGKG